jgi:hypothetical protein
MMMTMTMMFMGWAAEMNYLLNVCVCAAALSSCHRSQFPSHRRRLPFVAEEQHVTTTTVMNNQVITNDFALRHFTIFCVCECFLFSILLYVCSMSSFSHFKLNLSAF